MLMSPSNASDAAVPPNVGSVSTEKKGTPAACRRSTAAFTLASCMRASTPSCMLAPPDVETSTYGFSDEAACCISPSNHLPCPIIPFPLKNLDGNVQDQLGLTTTLTSAA